MNCSKIQFLARYACAGTSLDGSVAMLKLGFCNMVRTGSLARIYGGLIQGAYSVVALLDSIEFQICEALRAMNQTLATAESCTGGLISHRLTNVPGASEYFSGGVVTYSNDAKMSLLDVSDTSLWEYGAVSELVAREMAEGVRRKFDTDIGLSVTGIAGPTGGTSDKPVGLVFVALATDNHTKIVRNEFDGNREEIKEKTAAKALSMIMEYLK